MDHIKKQVLEMCSLLELREAIEMNEEKERENRLKAFFDKFSNDAKFTRVFDGVLKLTNATNKGWLATDDPNSAKAALVIGESVLLKSRLDDEWFIRTVDTLVLVVTYNIESSTIIDATAPVEIRLNYSRIGGLRNLFIEEPLDDDLYLIEYIKKKLP